ncbi:hypothetical protein IAT38_005785 [Cryptococcus sp. DSM 104549]
MFAYPTPAPTPCDPSPSSPSNITPANFLPLFPVWYQILQDLKRANPALLSRVNKSLHAELNPLIYGRIVLDKSLPVPWAFRTRYATRTLTSQYDTLRLVESLNVLDLQSVYRLLHAIHLYRHSRKYALRQKPLFPKLQHLHFGSEVIWACASEEEAANEAETTLEGREFMTLGERLGMALEGMMSPRRLCLDAVRYGDSDAAYDTYDQAVNQIVAGISPLETVTWHIPLDHVKLPWGFTHLVDGADEMRWELAETGWEDTEQVIRGVFNLYGMAVEDRSGWWYDLDLDEEEMWPKQVKRFYVVPYREDLETVWVSHKRSYDAQLLKLVVMRGREEKCECRRSK